MFEHVYVNESVGECDLCGKPFCFQHLVRHEKFGEFRVDRSCADLVTRCHTATEREREVRNYPEQRQRFIETGWKPYARGLTKSKHERTFNLIQHPDGWQYVISKRYQHVWTGHARYATSQEAAKAAYDHLYAPSYRQIAGRDPS
jgi:hypothetical protein